MPDGSTYIGVHTTPIDEKTRQPLKPGAINGGIMKRSKDVKTKMDMMWMGFYAYVQDAEGNVIGLWEDMKK